MTSMDDQIETNDELGHDEAQTSARPTFGQRLATARMAAGLTIPEVADRLKIREPYLHALEDGRIEELPDHAFAYSATRSYAKLLGLNAQPLIDDIRHWLDEPRPEVNLQVQTPVLDNEKPAWIFIGLGLAIIAVVAAVTLLLTRGEEAEPVEVRLPEEVQERIDEVDRVIDAQNGVIAPSLDLAYDDDPLPETPSLDNDILAVETPTWKRFGLASPLRRPSAEEISFMEELRARIAGNLGSITNDQAEPEPLVIVALERVWVSIEKDGAIFKEEVLPAGAQVEVGDGVGYTLTAGNAGAVGVRVGDKDYPAFGDIGEVVQKIDLTREKILEQLAGPEENPANGSGDNS